MPTEPPIVFGPLRVHIDPVRAKAYARETGGDGQTVPLAYPAVWLTDPTLATLLNDLCAAQDAIPVHESQSFHYDQPLHHGENYDIHIEIRRDETPPRLIIEATVLNMHKTQVAKIDAMLRLVPRAGLGAAV